MVGRWSYIQALLHGTTRVTTTNSKEHQPHTSWEPEDSFNDIFLFCTLLHTNARRKKNEKRKKPTDLHYTGKKNSSATFALLSVHFRIAGSVFSLFHFLVRSSMWFFVSIWLSLSDFPPLISLFFLSFSDSLALSLSLFISLYLYCICRFLSHCHISYS